MSDFEKALSALINKHSLENGSNTPDYLLAGYMRQCLEVFNSYVRARDRWYDIDLCPGKSTKEPSHD